jgi:hypothetical protein
MMAINLPYQTEVVGDECDVLKLQIADINGGSAPNAIATAAKATVVVPNKLHRARLGIHARIAEEDNVTKKKRALRLAFFLDSIDCTV